MTIVVNETKTCAPTTTTVVVNDRAICSESSSIGISVTKTPSHLYNSLDENSFNEVFAFLETSFKYRVLSILNKQFRKLVYMPEHNPTLYLDFTRAHELDESPRVDLSRRRSGCSEDWWDHPETRHTSPAPFDSYPIELLHLKLFQAFSISDLFLEGNIFSKLQSIRIKFKFEPTNNSLGANSAPTSFVFNSDLVEFSIGELATALRAIESIKRIELISPPMEFLTDLFHDDSPMDGGDCYCLDENEVNCVDERFEDVSEFFPNLESLVIIETEIDSIKRIFNYNVFGRFQKLKELVFNEIYSMKHVSTSCLFPVSSPRSQSLSFDDSVIGNSERNLNESSAGGGQPGERLSLGSVEASHSGILSYSTSPVGPSQILSDSFSIYDRAVASYETVDTLSPSSTAISLVEVIDLYMIPFNEGFDFMKRQFLPNMPHLRVLKIRGLSSSKHANLTAGFLDQLLTVEDSSGSFSHRMLPCLEEIEIGFLTQSFVDLLLSVCSSSSLKKISIASRVDLKNMTDNLWDFAETFSHMEEINFRITKNSQLEEIIDVIENTRWWKHSLKKIKISWSLINTMKLVSLVWLRDLLKHFEVFTVSSCGIVAERWGEEDHSIIDSPVSGYMNTVSARKYNSPFDKYFYEFCQERIFCNCEQCLDRDEPGEENENHLRRIALQEWENEIPNELKKLLEEQI